MVATHAQPSRKYGTAGVSRINREFFQENLQMAETGIRTTTQNVRTLKRAAIPSEIHKVQFRVTRQGIELVNPCCPKQDFEEDGGSRGNSHAKSCKMYRRGYTIHTNIIESSGGEVEVIIISGRSCMHAASPRRCLNTLLERRSRGKSK